MNMDIHETTKYVLERITELRLSRPGLTESQLSKDLGHKAGYLGTMNAEQKMVSFRTLLRVCDYFQITLEDFFSKAYKGKASVEYLADRLEVLLDDEDILKMIKLLEIMDKEDLQGLLRLGDKFVNAK